MVCQLATLIAFILPHVATSPEIEQSDNASITIRPSEVHLGGHRRQQQLVITAISEHGTSIDITHNCEILIPQPPIVTAQQGVVMGLEDEITELRVC